MNVICEDADVLQECINRICNERLRCLSLVDPAPRSSNAVVFLLSMANVCVIRKESMQKRKKLVVSQGEG